MSLNSGNLTRLPIYLDSEAVLRGLSLQERKERLRPEPHETPSATQLAKAHRISARWANEPPFDNRDLFLARLAAEGLSEEEFLGIVGSDVKDLKDLTLLHWVDSYQDAINSSSEEFWHPIRNCRVTMSFVSRSKVIDFCEPVISLLYSRLEAFATARWPDSHSLACLLDHFALSLARTLHVVIERVLVLEMNVYRLLNQLEGLDSTARFAFFHNLLRTPAFRHKIYGEYPGLLRSVVSQGQLWFEFACEFLERFHSDITQLQAVLNEANPLGQVIEVRSDAGDRHNGARRVCVVTFSSKTKIVYKPRSLALDLQFYKLVKKLNDDTGYEWFRPIAVLDCGAYGWAQFVTVQTCETRDEVRRFYRRMGAHVALFYVLRGTDFHHENILAHGEYPVPIDIETLFQPVLPPPPGEPGRARAFDIQANSVLGSSILPSYHVISETVAPFDVSAIGASERQQLPPSPRAVDVLTEFMRIEMVSPELSEVTSRPRLRGSEVHPTDYTEDVAAGFNIFYEYLYNHRDDLVREMEHFRRVQIRYIPRPSVFYFRLLLASSHPDAMRDCLEKDRVLGRLCLDDGAAPWLRYLYKAECRHLDRGDVPAFYTTPESLDIWTLDGHYIAEYFSLSGLESVRARFDHLSKRDKRIQDWLVRTSIKTTEDLKGSAQKHLYVAPTGNGHIEETVTELLIAFADRLSDLAIYNDNRATWMNITAVREYRWTLQPMGYGLYDGLFGCILFLAALHHRTGSSQHLELARSALRTALDLSEIRAGDSLGAYSGLSSVIFGLMLLTYLWDDRSLLDHAVHLLPHLERLIAEDNQFDIINGSAGALVILLALYQWTGNVKALNIARECGCHLVAKQEAQGRGAAWRSSSTQSDRPLTGFSHGAAGIAWALLKLWAQTGERVWRAAAEMAIDYERSVFRSDLRNWPDFRTGGENHQQHASATVAWCHGAPGIGMARIDNLLVLDDESIREEIQVALQTTLEALGGNNNHSLCHGDLGNLELLLEVQRRMPSSESAAELERQRRKIVETIASDGCVFGSPAGIEVPGLLTGLAGIGYGLLRLIDRDSVPSILLLKTRPAD